MVSANTVAGVVIAVIGVVLVGIGFGAYMYEETVHFQWLVDIEVVNRPYQGEGMVLMVLGIIVLVVGIIVAALPSKTPAPAAQQPVYANAPGTTGFCQYCGRPLAPGAAFCPGCGRKST